jgi:hypothetical protein
LGGATITLIDDGTCGDDAPDDEPDDDDAADDEGIPECSLATTVDGVMKRPPDDADDDGDVRFDKKVRIIGMRCNRSNAPPPLLPVGLGRGGLDDDDGGGGLGIIADGDGAN